MKGVIFAESNPNCQMQDYIVVFSSDCMSSRGCIQQLVTPLYSAATGYNFLLEESLGVGGMYPMLLFWSGYPWWNNSVAFCLLCCIFIFISYRTRLLTASAWFSAFMIQESPPGKSLKVSVRRWLWELLEMPYADPTVVRGDGSARLPGAVKGFN